jgi:carboxyl-terminal processing protease
MKIDKKIINKFLPLTAILIFSVFIVASNDNLYFKINRSFEIFGAIFREVSSNYVEEIEPNELIKSGIEGMLKDLDPYTVFYDLNDIDDIDILTTGAYTGLGITVSVRDSMLTVVGLRDGFSAQRCGLRIGDHLYKIDSTVVLNITTKDLRLFTRGSPGSTLKLWVLRDGIKDTLFFKIPREQINMSSVTYSGIIDGDVAYIKLERFSRNSGDEVRLAINEMMKKRKFNGLILDLRDNPGGLLESAVSICELFLPKGSNIVTTRGRNQSESYTYRSYQSPLVPDLPLAVLINEYSASASEIVAGAIQDYDRGLIIGKRSYGKGLVQSVFELPYHTNLKMTTAKYYTPSGRCIQKVEGLRISFKNNKNSSGIDTSIFFTKNNRRVYEYKGILPDTIVEEKNLSDFVSELVRNNFIFNFANSFSATKDSLSDDFVVNKSLLEKFQQFAESKSFSYKSDITKNIIKLKSLAQNSYFTGRITEKINVLERSIKEEEKELFRKYYPEISSQLETEIFSRFRSQKDMIARNLMFDNTVKTAKDILQSNNYKKILVQQDANILNKNN